MNSQDEQNLKEKFLQEMATKYHFSGDTLLSFLARFSQYNAEKSNTNVALEIEWNRKINPNGLETKLQRELTNICNVLENNGCKLPQRGKGIRDIWKNAYHWLWNEKYPEWKKTQLVSSFSTQENIKIEKEIIIKPENCQIMTEHIIKRLTTNPLTDRDGINFNLDDIYVPLGLYEKVKKPRINKNSEGAELYHQLEQYEVTRKFEKNDEFFREVLVNQKSPKSQGSKIAIIGEAGAGKSTQLQKIATWIFKQNDQDVVIWVSLADLKDKTLKEYLLQDWLENVFKVAIVTEEMETALTNLFNSGKVWLLLDGIDEMGVNNPLATIADYLKPTWLNQARIILTCRLNVWESGNNYLSNFDVYKNLDFSEDQVKEFINKFFAENHDLGCKLITELNQTGKERIRNLIKNPLRLTLLCQFWYRRIPNQGGGLPDTKAGLYQNFVNSIYKWKEKEIPTTSTQRKELNEALGKLALEALDQDSSYFRLTHDQIVKVLGETDQGLGKLALDIGWLNEVGVAQENLDQVVYAFYHSSFQEYFAALASGR
jgi:predicted NACHT family NTPase